MTAQEPDDLLLRLRRFRSDYFPRHQQRFQDLVAEGQHPKTLFIGCSDSRLMPYPMVRSRVECNALTLHGWHYVIEEGEVHVFDALAGDFVPASLASNAGTGPYQPYVEHDGSIL